MSSLRAACLLPETVIAVLRIIRLLVPLILSSRLALTGIPGRSSLPESRERFLVLIRF
jgi:hypothetical protein